ncbi:MAG: hypothetical protein V2J24_00020 [Pseudomonadales bacterium]|jgi:hypothetical protein|nr:hypothetical protein [Pseudomonadales bacterium]
MNAAEHSAKVLELDAFRPENVFLGTQDATHVASPCREKLFVQVILCDREPELVGRTFSCRTTRASGSHVEFTSDRSLPIGALVDLWVDVAACTGKFFLSGRVRWTRASDDARHVVGIELQDGAATDFDAWRDLHA